MTIENNLNHAVVYLRIARSHPDEATAVSYQREGCRRIAERHSLTIIREYVDIGRPARLDQQVELLRLLDDLHQRCDVVAVIVWDFARLGRSMEQLDEVTHRIQECGAKVVTITGVEAAERLIWERQTGHADREEGPRHTAGHDVRAPRAVIYLRVSGHLSQAETTRLLDAHRRACMRRATELGAEVVREFVEYGSARVSTAERPILQDMLRFLDTRRDIDHVVCFNQSRLAHNARRYVEIMQAVEASGADIAIAALPGPGETKGGDK